MKKIVITGGAGLVGSYAALYYAKKGKDVIVFDNLMRSKLFGFDKKSVEYNWEYLGCHPNITRIKGDVRNRTQLSKAIDKKTDLIIHAAGQPGVRTSVNDPQDDFSINAQGTLNVLETMRTRCPGACFIYCSTNKVYGENVDTLKLKELKKRYAFKHVRGVSESMPVDKCGHTPYGASKYTGDLYTQEYARMYGLKTGVFRMSCIYGERQFGFEDQGWIAHFIIAATKRKPITIYGDGKQVRDVLYVKDLMHAFDLFAKSKLNCALYNIGGGPNNTLSLLEFIEIIKEKITSKLKVSFSGWRPFDQKVYVSDIAKIKKELGFTPYVSVAHGINTVINWVSLNKNIFP